MKDHSFMSQFDDFGRCIPGNLSSAVQKKTRRYFRCEQPSLDLEVIYDRASRHFSHKPECSLEEFEGTITRLLGSIKANDQIANLTKGVYVPYLIPKMKISDLGTSLENLFIPAVGKSFSEKFPDYNFTNHNQKPLSERFAISENSGHVEMVQALAEKDIIGIYFPAMDAYSLPAAREQIQKLDGPVALAGGIDTSAALVGSPDLLMRKEGYPPLLWFSALESIDPNENFHFEAYGYDLTFNRRVHLGNADEYWVSGISVYQK